jgi:hypothetical protein
MIRSISIHEKESLKASEQNLYLLRFILSQQRALGSESQKLSAQDTENTIENFDEIRYKTISRLIRDQSDEDNRRLLDLLHVTSNDEVSADPPIVEEENNGTMKKMRKNNTINDENKIEEVEMEEEEEEEVWKSHWEDDEDPSEDVVDSNFHPDLNPDPISLANYGEPKRTYRFDDGTEVELIDAEECLRELLKEGNRSDDVSIVTEIKKNHESLKSPPLFDSHILNY